MKIFLLVRVYALAQILQGFLRFFGIKIYPAMFVAKKIGRERGKKVLEAS